MARTVFIGDVHGCASELGALVELVAPTGDDRFVFVGDLVARGPDTRRVLGMCRELRADAVLGNHEQRLLQARRARAAGEVGPPLGPDHEALLRSLTEEDWVMLEALPLSIDLPEHGVRVVHAGVLPSLSFSDQSAWTLTHIRSIDSEGRASDLSGEASWAASYAGAPHIVFGHDARRGLQLHPSATGIDTGCVYGGELTALLLTKRQAVPEMDVRRDAVLCVSARDSYYQKGR